MTEVYLRSLILCVLNRRIYNIEFGRYTFARIPIFFAVRCCSPNIDCLDRDRAEQMVWQRLFATPVPA